MQEYLEAADFTHVSDNCYICAVFTCGKSCGIAADEMREVLQRKGLRLSAVYAVCMPDTYIPMFPLASEEKQREISSKTEQSLSAVVLKIHKQESAFEMPPAMPKPMAKMIRRINIPKQKKTDHFWVNGSCIGCRICEQVCPLNIIQVREGKPVWTKDGCACCLGCVHRCPQKAIQVGKKTEERGRYTNPNVKL